MQIRIHAQHLRKSFATPNGERLPVLSDLSFEIAEGSFAVLVGPSGCGKSTILRILAGLDSLDNGEVGFEDRSKSSLGPTSIHFVNAILLMQGAPCFPWLTVEENVAFPARFDRHRAAVTERIKRVLHDMRLADFRLYYPSQLSGGMLQRVALARTLVVEPQVLLLDEPFGSLDAKTREEMQNLVLKTWKRSRITTLLVTHDLEEAASLATHLFVCGKPPLTKISAYHVSVPQIKRTPEHLKSIETFLAKTLTDSQYLTHSPSILFQFEPTGTAK